MTADSKDRTAIVLLIEKLSTFDVPYAWLSKLRNHTAVLVLADIVAAFAGGFQVDTERWDGRELLLEYKELGSRLGFGERTLTRTIGILTRRRLITYRRRDRVVNGKKVRNVVGVIPNLGAIARLTRIAGRDIMAARPAHSRAPAPARRGGTEPADKTEAAESIPLTDFQDSLLRAYQWSFNDIIGAPYSVTSAQQAADRRAAASISIGTERGAGRKYLARAEQYVQAMADKGQQQLGNALEAAFDRDNHVRDAYTFEAFFETCTGLR
jgi:hypothetical protein